MKREETFNFAAGPSTMPRSVLEKAASELLTYRGTGMSDRLILAAEELARAMGIASVRVDTHRRNGAMKKLLSRCGYQFRGNVLYGVGEGHDPRRQAFEKILK